MNPASMMRPIVAAIVALAATIGGMAQAQEGSPAVGEQVALALAAAQSAQGERHRDGLAAALAVIDRSGARPLPGWNGPDPVPQWRALVPAKAAADATPPMRGSPLGPGYRSGQVLGGRSDSFEQVFLSGRKASIALSTPGNASLSLRVLDSGRNPVCTIGDARRACRWVPLFTQRYLIEVRNSGSNVADYFLVVD